MSLRTLPRTDPTAILRYRDGIYAVDLLTAAIVEFDFFTRLEDEPGCLEEICERLGWAPRPADVLITLAKANGFVSEGPEGTIRTTALAREHLCSRSPWSLRGYFESLKDRQVARDFVQVLQTGKPAHWSGHDEAEADWHGAMQSEEFATAFTEAMDCRGVFLGKVLADQLAGELTGRRRVLDIGGGSGVYACALAANQPHLTGAVMEQAPVDALAKRKIAERGLADRVEVITGDMFAGKWPTNAEVHLFSNVMHDWDIPQIQQLLAHSAASLASGGIVVIHETFLNGEKTGPLPVAEYSCILMHSTQGRCYSITEMARLLEDAGFVRPRYVDTAGDRGAVIAEKA
ncbi:MAG: methyltransferase [Verrucomicrobiales bacterium]|nr:methyltransferase [Verrucomicrobiales bacterium]